MPYILLLKKIIAWEEQAKYSVYSTTQEWVKIFKETGEFSPKTICGKQPTQVNLSELYQQVLKYPERFQYEHAQTFGVTQSAFVPHWINLI